MSIVEPGTPAPEFELTTERGRKLTKRDIEDQTTVLVFFPSAFSPVCTDQFNVYQEVLGELQARGATLYGVSCDSSWSLKAFRKQLGVAIEMLSDFEPKGEVSRAFGAFIEPGGVSNRSLVVIGPDGVVKWSYEAANPGELPGANLLFDGLEAAAGAEQRA